MKDFKLQMVVVIDAEGAVLEFDRKEMPCIEVIFPGNWENTAELIFSGANL